MQTCVTQNTFDVSSIRNYIKTISCEITEIAQSDIIRLLTELACHDPTNLLKSGISEIIQRPNTVGISGHLMHVPIVVVVAIVVDVC